MRIIISTLAIIALIVVVFALPARFRKRIQRRIDSAISKSAFKQLSFLAVVTGFSFGMFLLFMLLIHGNIKLQISDWLLSFINPGNFFANSADLDYSQRTWAIISGIVGLVFLSGLLISVISNIMERRVDSVKNGKVHYYFKNHVVIIGYDRMSIGLIGQFAKDERYRNSEIVLLTTQIVPKVHHDLFSGLETKIEKKITIVSGNRTSVEDLERLNIHLCKEVFILGENEEYDNDSLNVECVKKIYGILSETSAGIIVRCNVLFEYQCTFAVFQRQDIDRLKDRIDFVPFSFYEMWAQKVFVEGKYDSPEKETLEYTPLDRGGINAGSEQNVQLVVIGMQSMGVALGLQAAHLCHFPNFVTKGIKTRITFIDENADVEMNYMRGRYRHLFDEVDVYYREVNRNDMISCNIFKDEGFRINTCGKNEIFTDIEFEFIRARVEYPVIQDYLAGLSRNRNICLTVAICFSFPPKALAAGLYLPDELYYNDTPVLIRQEISHCTLDMLTKDGKYRNVKPFGMLDNCYDLRKADNLLPMMVKYLYDNTSADKEEVVKTFAPDILKKSWRNWKDKNGEELRNITALKWSNIYNANMAHIKKRSLDVIQGKELSDEQINLLARIEHNRWIIEKLLMGYRPCTPEETAAIADGSQTKQYFRDRFVHNDLKPYHALSKDDKGIQANKYDINISKSFPFMLSELEKYDSTKH